MAGQAAGFARKIGENHLRHVLGEVGVARDLPQRRGKNQVDVPRHEFVEGRLGTCQSVDAEELSVVVHLLSTLIAPAAAESGQGI